MPRLEDLPADDVATAVSRAVVDAVVRGGGTETVVARALADAKRRLGLGGGPASPSRSGPVGPMRSVTPTSNGGARSVVTEVDVRAAARAGRTELSVGSDALVTPLARDAASDLRIRLVEA